tara:strand:- start:1706 stop:1963 length:258 start_codon:yes stop_codon:yes gene_type:complete
VNNDDEKEHRRFPQNNKLPFLLLFDENNMLRNQLGIKEILGIFDGRVTYIIDSKGIILRILNDFINGPEHVTEALRILDEILLKP